MKYSSHNFIRGVPPSSTRRSWRLQQHSGSNVHPQTVLTQCLPFCCVLPQPVTYLALGILILQTVAPRHCNCGVCFKNAKSEICNLSFWVYLSFGESDSTIKDECLANASPSWGLRAKFLLHSNGKPPAQFYDKRWSYLKKQNQHEALREQNFIAFKWPATGNCRCITLRHCYYYTCDACLTCWFRWIFP